MSVHFMIFLPSAVCGTGYIIAVKYNHCKDLEDYFTAILYCILLDIPLFYGYNIDMKRTAVPDYSRLTVGTRVVIDADYDFRHGQTGTITLRMGVGYGVQLDGDNGGPTGFPFDEVRAVGHLTATDQERLLGKAGVA